MNSVPDIRSYRGKWPQIAASAYIDPASVIIGDVVIGEEFQRVANVRGARRCPLHPDRQPHEYSGRLHASRDEGSIAAGAGR